DRRPRPCLSVKVRHEILNGFFNDLALARNFMCDEILECKGCRRYGGIRNTKIRFDSVSKPTVWILKNRNCVEQSVLVVTTKIVGQGNAIPSTRVGSNILHSF